ncbi:hypothetical protein [Paraburkholderia dipogonis]|uniref:hypothetical protein n=1 Tax=Paraburkholderia dipogonis TaxID=1211383 RepID=UPI0038B95E66
MQIPFAIRPDGDPLRKHFLYQNTGPRNAEQLSPKACIYSDYFPNKTCRIAITTHSIERPAEPTVYRVDKKTAGHTLNGVTHDEFPA